MDEPGEHFAEGESYDEESPEPGATRSMYHIRQQLLHAFALDSDHEQRDNILRNEGMQELSDLAQPIYELLRRLDINIDPIPAVIVATLAELMFPGDQEFKNKAYEIDDEKIDHPMKRVSELRRTLWFMMRRALGPDSYIPSLSNPTRIKLYVEAALRAVASLQ